jgi:hypothetical protein
VKGARGPPAFKRSPSVPPPLLLFPSLRNEWESSRDDRVPPALARTQAGEKIGANATRFFHRGPPTYPASPPPYIHEFTMPSHTRISDHLGVGSRAVDGRPFSRSRAVGPKFHSARHGHVISRSRIADSSVLLFDEYMASGADWRGDGCTSLAVSLLRWRAR